MVKQKDVFPLKISGMSLSIITAYLFLTVFCNSFLILMFVWSQQMILIYRLECFYLFPEIRNSVRFRQQVGSGLPLKKQLWQQTVKAKIKNQAALLKSKKLPDQYLKNLIPKVLSGDKSNREAVASKYYWKILFEPLPFRRNREGKPPNNLLNYGYAILRAVIARSLVASGMLPMLGIHHHNRYDPFPLADDIMEPYRPFVDEIVRDMVDEEFDLTRLTPEMKKPLLEIPVTAVKLGNEKLPLMLAASRTSASLSRCFSGNSTKIIYPEICG